MDDVRGLFLGMPHGTTPAAVTTVPLRAVETFKRKRVGQTAVSDDQISLVTLNELAKKARNYTVINCKQSLRFIDGICN